MNEAPNPLFELYKLSERFGPEIERIGGRLKKVIFEIDGRDIIFNMDEREYPRPEPKPAYPPPPPPPIPRLAPPVSRNEDLPLPPLPGDWPAPAAPASKPGRTDPVEGIEPLTDNDPCPTGKAHTGKPLKDVPADFLDWLYGQPWLRKKYPRLWAYIVRHQDVIAEELKRTERAR